MAHQAIDSLDRRLIGLLLRDARMSFISLAKSLAVSDAAVYKRTQRLLQTGVIHFTASANVSRVGTALPVLIALKVAPECVQAATDVLAGHPNMVRVSRTSGQFGILALVYLDNSSEVASFMTREVPGIAGLEAMETALVVLTRSGRTHSNAVGPIDSKDWAIIWHLQQNSRQDAVELSRKTGVPARTVRRRLSRLMESEIVIPMVVVRPRTLGFCEGAISLKVKPKYLNDVWEYVSTRLPRTHYASLTIGAFNIIMRVWGDSREDLDHVAEQKLKKLPGVIDSKLLVIEEITLGRWRNNEDGRLSPKST